MSSDPHNILFVLGTRPEIIKLAPVIRAAEESDHLTIQIVHTGQHYDEELNDVFFEGLELPQPDEWLGVGSGTQGEQTGEALQGIERIIATSSPDAVIALGDTNAVLSAAIATSKMEPEFAHLEAGIRSFDQSMPEEVNRLLADRVTDLAFAPTDTAVTYLEDEGITSNVWMVGNTVVDACFEHAPIADEKSAILDRLNLGKDEYTVATIHRPRNTDNRDRLKKIVETLDDQSFPVVFPAHPRTKEALDDIGFISNGSLFITEPLDYLDFLKLLKNARLAVTDSGGVQEEASILEIPCLTVRPNTERPETVEAGVNRLIEPEDLENQLTTVYQNSEVHREMTGRPDLYGDGTAADQIISVLEDRF